MTNFVSNSLLLICSSYIFQTCDSYKTLFFFNAGKIVKSLPLVCHTVIHLVDMYSCLAVSLEYSESLNALLLFCC